MRRSAQRDNKSLKTFFAYGGIVLFFVVMSLLVKTIFVVQDSKVDSKNQFILAIYQSNELKEIIKFNPSKSEIFVLQSSNDDVEVIPDATVHSTFDLPLGENVAQTMRTIGYKYNSLETELTILDIIQLTIFAHRAPVEVLDKNYSNDFFVDELISSENISVQIINASGVSGMGSRMEKSLKNLGYSVVAVTTSRSEEKFSKIKYFDEETYTLKKLSRLLSLPSEKAEREGIADIIIVVGEDGKETERF